MELAILKKMKNQCWAIRREFWHVGPTLFKNALGVGFIAYLAVGGFLFVIYIHI